MKSRETLRRWAGIVVCLSLLAGMSNDCLAADAPTTKPVDYFGRVVASNGKPIQGAAITISQFQQEKRAYVTVATTSADSDGKFQYTGPPPTVASTLAVIQAKGYGLMGGKLQDNSADDPVEFRLRASTDVHIRFIDSDGKPVTGLKVCPRGVSQLALAGYVEIPPDMQDRIAETTGTDGSCVLKDMPRGGSLDYTYADTRFALPILEDRITLGLTTLTDVGMKQIQPGCSIEGQVTSADTKKGVAGAEILSTGMVPGPNNQNRRVLQVTLTDLDGKYAFSGLRSGQYELQLNLPPDQVQHYAVPVVDPFPVAPGEHRTGKDIALITGGIITGKVTAAGAPVADAGVRAATTVDSSSGPTGRVMMADGQFATFHGTLASDSSTTTGKDGTYTMHVTPGQVLVGLDRAPVGYIIPRTSTTSPSTMTVNDNQTITRDFELMIGSAAELKGEVVDHAGLPVSGATIILEPLSARTASAGNLQTQTQSDSEGKFTVRGVPVGTGIHAHKGNSGTASRILVSDANRNRLTITLEKGVMAWAAVQVLDNSGKAVPDAQISVTQRMANLTLAVPGGITDDQGKLVVSSLFPDLTYTIEARAKGYGTGSITLSQLQPGKQHDESLQLPKADSFVAGMVLDENQLPLMEADVYVGSGRSGGQTVKTDLTGHFRANGIVAGDTLTVYTTAGNRRGQQTPERVLAGTSDLVLIHNPTAPPQPTTGPRGTTVRLVP